MLKVLKKINYILPVWVTYPLKYIPNSFIFGKSYLETKKNISFSQETAKKNLFNILVYARQHTCFGKENIPKNFNISEVFNVLKQIPTISSYDLANNLNYYISDEINSLNSYSTTTGGSGRNPTTVYLSNNTYGIEWAHMHNIWEYAGYKRNKNLKLTFRGYNFPKGILYRFNPIYNEIMVDPFQLWQSDFRKFINDIKKYNITALHGYPSLINIFMEKLKSENIKFDVKMIFLGSEGSTIEQRKILAKFFKAKVITWYGQTEKVILACDTNLSNEYAIYSSYGHADILSPNENGFGEILGTTFINKALPLINYRTGDFGKLIVRDNNKYLTDIVGRWGKDFVYLNKEMKIPTSAINLHTDIQEKILFYQIQQDKYGELEIRILPKSQFIDNSLEEEQIKIGLEKDLKTRLKDFKINIYCVKNENEIIRSVRGKQIMLVQNIKDIAGE